MPKDIKEIVNKKEIRLGWIAFIIISFHFILVILSIIPAEFTSKKINKFSNAYTDPIFDQTWAMFAPCPIIESKLRVKYYFENDSTDWLDPIKEALATHQSYRFTYHGNIVVGYSNMLGFLGQRLNYLDIKTNEYLNFSDLRELRLSYENRQLYNYIFGYAHEKFESKPIDCKIYVSYKDVKSSKIVNYYFFNYK